MNLDEDFLAVSDLKNDKLRAYATIIDKYYDSLYRYILNLSNDRSLAEDIVQEVFMTIWEKRHNLNTEIPLRKMLYRSAYNRYINLYKKNRAIGILEEKYFRSIQILTEEKDIGDLDEKLKILRGEIKNLPPKCKKVFLLSKREGLTNKEISKYLNISVNTVENHISKAFSILRAKLKDLYS